MNRIIERTSKVLAVVVTYKRPELLERCLVSLTKQSYECDVLVVNNCKDDKRTIEVLKKFQNDWRTISSHNMEFNRGGAGGFRKGIELSVSNKYSYSWLMDDDASPEQDSLFWLINGLEKVKVDSSGRETSFACSLVLTDSGKVCKVNLPRLVRNPLNLISNAAKVFEIDQCSFVSVLFKNSAIENAGMPVPQMFIGGDDLEYTRRISKVIGNGLMCLDSVVRHSTQLNLPSYLVPTTSENYRRKRREFENYFSTLWAHKEFATFFKGLVRYELEMVVNSNKRKYFWKINRGVFQFRNLVKAIREASEPLLDVNGDSK